MAKTISCSFVVKLFLACTTTIFVPEKALELSLQNLDTNLSLLKHSLPIENKADGFLLGPWLLDKKMSDILSPEQLVEAGVAAEQKIIIAHDKDKNIYQLHVLRQGPHDCSIHALRNALYALSFFSAPQNKFSSLYATMLSPVNSNGIDLCRDDTRLGVSYITKMIKEKQLPCTLPEKNCLPDDSYDNIDKIIEIDSKTWIASNSPTMGRMQGYYAKFGMPLIATIESLPDNSDILKRYVGDAVSLGNGYGGYARIIQLCTLFFQEQSFVFAINLHTYTIREHAVACIVNKYQGITEYIFCDSLNTLFPTAWEKNFQYALDSIVRWTGSLSYFQDCIVRKIYITTLFFTQPDYEKAQNIPTVFNDLGYKLLSKHNLFSNELYKRLYKDAFIEKLQEFKRDNPEQGNAYNDLIILFQNS